MIRAVLDTNVLASGFLGGGGAPDLILRAWLRRAFTLIVSADIVAELARTLERPYFQQRFSADRRQATLDLLRRRGEMTRLTAKVAGVATHPEDDLILAAALSAGAEYLVSGDRQLLVSGDRQLLALARYEGITIMAPRPFLAVLGEAA